MGLSPALCFAVSGLSPAGTYWLINWPKLLWVTTARGVFELNSVCKLILAKMMLNRVVKRDVGMLFSCRRWCLVFLLCSKVNDVLPQEIRGQITHRISEFFYVEGAETFDDANSFCEANGGALASITSREEFEIVRDELIIPLDEEGVAANFWLGNQLVGRLF